MIYDFFIVISKIINHDFLMKILKNKLFFRKHTPAPSYDVEPAVVGPTNSTVATGSEP